MIGDAPILAWWIVEVMNLIPFVVWRFVGYVVALAFRDGYVAVNADFTGGRHSGARPAGEFARSEECSDGLLLANANGR